MKCMKCVEDSDGGSKKKEGWTKPEKCTPTTHFCKSSSRSRKNNNADESGHNVFVDDADVDAEQEEGTAK